MFGEGLKQDEALYIEFSEPHNAQKENIASENVISMPIFNF